MIIHSHSAITNRAKHGWTPLGVPIIIERISTIGATGGRAELHHNNFYKYLN